MAPTVPTLDLGVPNWSTPCFAPLARPRLSEGTGLPRVRGRKGARVTRALTLNCAHSFEGPAGPRAGPAFGRLCCVFAKGADGIGLPPCSGAAGIPASGAGASWTRSAGVPRVTDFRESLLLKSPGRCPSSFRRSCATCLWALQTVGNETITAETGGEKE